MVEVLVDVVEVLVDVVLVLVDVVVVKLAVNHAPDSRIFNTSVEVL